MEKWHNMPWVEVVKQLNSDSNQGLNQEQAKLLLKLNEKAQVNTAKAKELTTTKNRHKRQIYGEIWVWTLLCITAGFTISNQYAYTAVSIVLLVINIYLYNKNKKYISGFENELRKITNAGASVFRQGKIVRIPSSELVKGDIVMLSKGDIAPADIRIIESDALKVKESLVTGEILEVEKYETKMEEKELNLSEIKNIVFKSSQVVEGSGKGIVIATEGETEVDKNIRSYFAQHKDLRDSTSDSLYKLVSMFSLTYLFVLIILFLFFKDSSSVFMSMGEVSKMMLYSNIFLIPIAYFYSSKIMLSLQKKNGIFHSTLAAFSKMGKVDVLLIDKITGIADVGMKPQVVFTNDSNVDLTGDFDRNEENMSRIISISSALIDGFSKLKPTDSNFEIMLKSFWDFGKENIRESNDSTLIIKKLKSIHYDNERRIETSIIKIENNFRANMIGNLDSILNRCKYIMKNGVEKEISLEDLEKIKEADLNMCQEQLNTQAVAYRNFNYEPNTSENIESNLVFVGIVGFADSFREDAIESLHFLRELNVKTIILTSEPKITAVKLSEKIFKKGSTDAVLSGIEMDSLNNEELLSVLDKVNIFSRINSFQKHRVLEAYKEKGVKTAIISGKLSDITALNNSFVGISEGENNLIMNSISDISIKEGKAESFIAAISSGKAIFKSLRKLIGLYAFFINSFMLFNMAGIITKQELLPNSLVVLVFNFFLFSISLMIFSFGSFTHYKVIDEKDNIKAKKYFSFTWCLKEILISIVFSALVIAAWEYIDIGFYRELLNFISLCIFEILLLLQYYKKY